MPLQRILNKIAGDYNEKQLQKLAPLVDLINQYDAERSSLTDEQIQAKTDEFKSRLANGESTDDIMPEAFATVKQACRRMLGQEISIKGETDTWKMVPYDVQLIGAIVLHQGKNAEMRTGEGKTLVATMPAYLNALVGKGVHVVTVNDYLASRDAEWMGHLYARLGLSVGSVVKSTPIEQRRAEYEKDITYVENSELGFDYLRDNLAPSLEKRNLIWRPLHYAIIDEVDSILIDEARTPLIISQPSEEPTEKYGYYAEIVKLLTPSQSKKKVSKGFLAELLKDNNEPEEEDDGGDYYIDEKTKSVSLSSNGIQRLEQLLKVDNLYRDLGYQEIHHIENALRAQAAYHKDKEYLLRDGQILLVDDHTGRVMPGRRFSQGLHQAIEAKEGVTVQRESKTLATITYQHFFKQYEKLSGMTGTAVTEAEEFEKIYDLEVITIPTNKPILRVDKNDQVYYNQDAKWQAVVDYVGFYHRMGVPMLIGTSAIHTSELVSKILNKMTLAHTVLNAKFHEQEAQIVKNAGKRGSIVVATNMAGRGTDIKLDTALYQELAANYAKAMAKNISKGTGFSAVIYSELEFDLTIDALEGEFGLTNEQIRQGEQGRVRNDTVAIKIIFNNQKKNKDQPFAEIRIVPADNLEPELEERDLHYGLFILGTEKHDSRRIDNQLRGRAGRQGDPGVSQFFVALDDEIMRKMGGEKIQAVARMMLSKDELSTTAFTQKQFTASIERAQKQMEGWHFGIRKHLFDYDSVINKQRTKIYDKRDEIIMRTEETTNDTESVIELDIYDEIKYFIDETVSNLVSTYTAFRPWNITELLESLQQITGSALLEDDYAQIHSAERLRERLTQDLHNEFDQKFASLEKHQILPYLRRIYLNVIDRYWMQHIDEMQYLREKVSLYGYAQLDPLVIYKKEAYDKFQRLLSGIQQETLGQVFRTDFSQVGQPGEVLQQLQRGERSLNMMEILKAVTTQLKSQPRPTQPTTHEQVTLSDGQQATVVEDDGDVEILEIQDDDSSTEITRPADQKLRPNDRIAIKHADGTIEHNVKYKKVKELIDSGQAEVIG